jgi:hypothetical protein
VLKAQGYTAGSLEDARTVAVSRVHGQVFYGDDSDQTKRWQDLLMQRDDGFCSKGVDLLQAIKLVDNDQVGKMKTLMLGNRLNCPKR